MTTISRTHKRRNASELRRRSDEVRALFWLHQANGAIRTAVLNEFKAHGFEITAEQWSVLSLLWQHGKATQAEIARQSGRDHPAVSRLVGSLETKGLVRRTALDRRTNCVNLTDKGRRLHRMLEPIFSTIIEKLLQAVSSSELKRTSQVLKRITLSLKARSQDLD